MLGMSGIGHADRRHGDARLHNAILEPSVSVRQPAEKPQLPATSVPMPWFTGSISARHSNCHAPTAASSAQNIHQYYAMLKWTPNQVSLGHGQKCVKILIHEHAESRASYSEAGDRIFQACLASNAAYTCTEASQKQPSLTF